MQARLKLESSFEVELGRIENYSIVFDKHRAGRVSFVKFKIKDPIPLGWGYLNEIYIEPTHRNRGIAREVVSAFGSDLRIKRENGILINAITVEKARSIYDHLGWKRINIDGNYQILPIVEVSNFCLRKACHLVADNFIRWQASSLN